MTSQTETETRECHRSLFYFAVVSSILLCPRDAFALPNAFFLVSTLGLILKLLVLAALSITSLMFVVKNWVVFSSKFKRIICIPIALLAILYTLSIFTHCHQPPPMIPKNVHYSEKCLPLGAQAEKYQLQPEDILVDFRLPMVFDLFHVMGACNLDANRAVEDPAWVEDMTGAGGKVVVATEWFFHWVMLFPEISRRSSNADKWVALELGQVFEHLATPCKKTGVCYLKRPISEIWDPEAECQRRPDDVQFLGLHWLWKAPETLHVGGSQKNEMGGILLRDLLFYRTGPRYAAHGFSFAGESLPGWREVSLSLALEPPYSEAIWVQVEGTFQPFHGDCKKQSSEDAAPAGSWKNVFQVGLTFDELGALPGNSTEPLFFTCDNAQNCAAAESLAFRAKNAGRSVLGYTIFGGPDLSPTLEGLANARGTPLAGNSCWWALLLAGLLVALGEWFLNPGRRPTPSSGWSRLTDRFTRHLLVLLAPLLTGILWGGLLIGLVGGEGSLGAMLAETSLLRFIVPPLFYWQIAAGIVRLAPQHGSRRETYAYWIMQSAIASVVVVSFFQMSLSIFAALALVVLGAVQMATAVLAFVLRSRPMPLSSDWGIVSYTLLGQRLNAETVGEKTMLQSMAIRHSFNVPLSLVLEGSLSELKRIDEIRPALHKRLKRRFGTTPLIVRSTAPTEDNLGTYSAGMYRSVPSVVLSGATDAIRSVGLSYEEQGVAPDTRVAVLVQEMLVSSWSGVAVRDERELGSGILVEANRGDNLDITSGRGEAAFRDRVGGLSRRWLGNSVEDATASLRAGMLARSFAHLESLLEKDLNIEFCVVGGRFVLLQARAIRKDSEEIPLGSRGSAHQLVKESLGCKWVPPSRIVLQQREFAEYLNGNSRATYELIRGFFSPAGALADVRPLRRWQFAGSGGPWLVWGEGACYVNRGLEHSVRYVLAQPLVQWHERLRRVTRRHHLPTLVIRLGQLEVEWDMPFSLLPSSDSAGVAEAILTLRTKLWRGPGALGLEILELLPKKPMRASEGLQFDPFFTETSTGGGPEGSEEQAGNYRAALEYSLDIPREYETKRGLLSLAELLNPTFRRSRFSALPSGTSLERLWALQARTRDLIAFGAYRLRLLYLALGELTGVGPLALHYSTDDLTKIASGMPVPVPDRPWEGRTTQPPENLSLFELDRWAAGEDTSSEPKSAAFWVCGGGEIKGQVTLPDQPSNLATEQRPIVVLEWPDVDTIRGLSSQAVLVCLGGTRLCHGALVAKQRNLTALFGAKRYKQLLVPGAFVRITRKGEINSVPQT